MTTKSLEKSKREGIANASSIDALNLHLIVIFILKLVYTQISNRIVKLIPNWIFSQFSRKEFPYLKGIAIFWIFGDGVKAAANRYWTV